MVEYNGKKFNVPVKSLDISDNKTTDQRSTTDDNTPDRFKEREDESKINLNDHEFIFTKGQTDQTILEETETSDVQIN